MVDENEAIPLYLFTYNCGKSLIKPESFINNLVPTFPDELADIYVFGLQELCPILDGSFHELANKYLIEYNDFFLRALKQKYGDEDTIFQTLGLHHIGAIGIIAISPYRLKFSKIRVAGSGYGYGYSSMKGGVGMRVLYKKNPLSDKSVELTFANAHLTANEGEYYYLQRNSNLFNLMRSLDFGDGYGLLKTNSHTFFMGDLNYRTCQKFSVTSPTTIDLLRLQDQSLVPSIEIENLVEKYDELYRGKTRGDIFIGFSEPCINFAPTYKFNVNTAIYSLKRSPSWCDRILYQSTYPKDDLFVSLTNDSNSHNKDFQGSLPKIHKYNSINSILQSDHQPVYLSITVPFNPPNPIVSSSGFLQILESEQPNRHSHSSDDSPNITSMFDETISGPTEIYMKPTRLDFFIQTYIRYVSDKFIGYLLYYVTTRNGRLYLLIMLLAVWLYRYFIT